MTPKALVCLCTPEPGWVGPPGSHPWRRLESRPQSSPSALMFLQKLAGSPVCPQNLPAGLSPGSSSHWPATEQSPRSQTAGSCWRRSLPGSAHTPSVQICCLDALWGTWYHLCSQAWQRRRNWCNSPGKKPGWARPAGSWGGGGWGIPSYRAAPWWRHRSRRTRGGWCAASTPPPGWARTEGSEVAPVLVQLVQCANTHLFTGEQEGCCSHQLEAVCSHRCGRQEPVHDVHRQAAALEGQAQIFVQRDEPADQRAPGLCSQLQAEIVSLIFLLIWNM